MADRVVKVRLLAEVQEYQQKMREAAKSTRETGTEAEKLAQKRDAFNALGGAALAFGGAMTVAAGAVAKTGIEYNTLQQTSRAALSTLLGGAEAANAQMDKLDEFATTSPFAKQVFIDAQQQLLGFGMEAERVVPTLDAIQNAVAATGGSNQDIAELVRIIAQLEGGVKISAETFNQFGTRGIDAAQLIGDAMGKTGQQIREEVTAGTLDADTAIQALTDGMQARFSGAADNVKETFDGAMDRVKAAWRDVAAGLMEPLVDPNGGGLLIDAANGVADLMRAFDSLPDSVKNTTGLLAGAAGATALVGGTALLAVPKIVDFKNHLETVAGVSTRGEKAILGLKTAVGGLVLAGVISAFMEWGDAANLSAENTEKLRRELEGTADAADILTIALKGTSEADAEGIWARGSGAWEDAKKELEDLAGLMDDAYAFNTTPWWEQLSNWRGPGQGAQAAFDTLKNIGTELASLADTNLPQASRSFRELGDGLNDVQLGQLLRELPDYREALAEIAEQNGIAATQGNLLAIATGDVSYASKGARDAVEQLIEESENSVGASEAAADGLVALDEAAKKVRDGIDAVSTAILGFGSQELDAREAARRFEEALDDLTTSVENNGTTLDISTEAGRNNEAALDAIAQKAKDVAAETYLRTESEEEATAALQRGRDELIKNLEQFGITGQAAQDYADELGLIPEDVATAIKLTGVDEAKQAIADLTSPRSILLNLELPGMTPVYPQLGSNPRPGEPGYGVVAPSANGNVFEYATGGFSGPGIYPGGPPIHKFAEPETVWEAYISGKPDERSRNIGVWMRAGENLGVLGGGSTGRDVQVTQNIYTQPGMTESDVARISQRRLQDVLLQG